MAKPERQGFGSTLVQRVLARHLIEPLVCSYESEGLRLKASLKVRRCWSSRRSDA